QTVLLSQGGAVLDTVSLLLLIGGVLNVQSSARIGERQEGLRQRCVGFRQGRSTDRGVEAGLERDVADRTVNQVYAPNFATAEGREVAVAVRTADFSVFTELRVTQQRDRDFSEAFGGVVFSRQEVSAAIQLSVGGAQRGAAAQTFGHFLAVFS